MKFKLMRVNYYSFFKRNFNQSGWGGGMDE